MSNILVCGPLKFRGIMQTLLDRPTELPDRKTVFYGGYELVVVDPMAISDSETLPEYALHPKDYGVVTLACYNNLEPYEIELINQFLRLGTVTEARTEVAEVIGNKAEYLIHHLKRGVPYAPVDFGPKTNRDTIYNEIELNNIQPVKYLQRARKVRDESRMRNATHEGSAQPLQSRK